MDILFWTKKEEIKELINTIEYCYTYLGALEPMMNRLITEKKNYDIEKWEELQFDVTMKIAKTKVLKENTRQKLRELGIY